MRVQKRNSGGTAILGLWLIMLMLGAMTSCQTESRGFVLPEGDKVTGEQVFVDLNCSRCHSIGDIKWSGSEIYGDPYVKLGEESSTVKTYGELVTSVINPSHKISQKSLNDEKLTLVEGMSKMELYRYNEIMTVQELVDLVSFLQSEYTVTTPNFDYPEHGM